MGDVRSELSGSVLPLEKLRRREMGMGFLTVSSRNKNVTSQAIAVKVAVTAQGRKYGYSLRKSIEPKMFGNCSAGRDSEPPMMGPSYKIL